MDGDDLVADCPYCDWRYDPYAECIGVRPVSGVLPILWDGALRIARGADAPNGRHTAAGAHICTAHPMEPEVLRFGPLAGWRPLSPAVAAFGF